jgi:hypothetical protein
MKSHVPLSCIRIALAALTGFVGVAVVPVPLAAASASVLPQSLPRTQCPTGTNLVLPSSTQTASDGWLDLRYEIGGTTSWESIPPVGFDVKAASDGLLLNHHLPTRPSTEDELTSWSTRLGHDLTHRSMGRCVVPGLSFSGSYHYSLNWGGDEFRAQSTYSFIGVRAFIQQPTVGTSCNSMRALGSWVGLGGDPGSTAALIQGGTIAFGPGYGSLAGYRSFYELVYGSYNNGPVLMNVNPNVGDSVWMSLQLYGSSTSRYAYIWISDGSQSDSAAVTVGNDPVTQSAEFIDERPAYGQNLFRDLPNYGWTMWTSMAVLRDNSSSWTGAYSEPTEWWQQMVNSSGSYLSKTTGTYSDNHMRDHWYACA